jgi:hypothetical protein
MVRPARTVLVTSKEEVDAALATADQVVVEGDDELLTYAINTAEAGAFKKEFVGVTVRLGTNSTAVLAGGKAPVREALHDEVAVFGDDHATEARSRSRSGIAIGVAVVALLIIAGAIGWYLRRAGELAVQSFPPPSLTTVPPSPLPVPPPASAPVLTPPLPLLGWGESVPPLLWPLVAIVAIVALFLIARQAISSGSNVTIVWKVTEKVSGRVVITKVRQQAQRRRAAA